MGLRFVSRALSRGMLHRESIRMIHSGRKS
jgi:hypothetical protein